MRYIETWLLTSLLLAIPITLFALSFPGVTAFFWSLPQRIRLSREGVAVFGVVENAPWIKRQRRGSGRDKPKYAPYIRFEYERMNITLPALTGVDEKYKNFYRAGVSVEVLYVKGENAVLLRGIGPLEGTICGHLQIACPSDSAGNLRTITYRPIVEFLLETYHYTDEESDNFELVLGDETFQLHELKDYATKKAIPEGAPVRFVYQPECEDLRIQHIDLGGFTELELERKYGDNPPADSPAEALVDSADEIQKRLEL